MEEVTEKILRGLDKRKEMERKCIERGYDWDRIVDTMKKNFRCWMWKWKFLGHQFYQKGKGGYGGFTM